MWQKDGVMFKNPLRHDGRQIWNPTAEQLTAAGYKDLPVPQPDLTKLKAGFAKFRQVCKEIGQLIGDSEFKGGFDEMDKLEASDAIPREIKTELASKWNGADKRCTYEAKKVGIGQPQWWYMCWEPEDE